MKKKEMIEFNDDIELTNSYSEKDSLDCLGIGLFGSNEEVNKLTKKFSVFK